MILYHGSNEIVKRPMILISDHTKDFSWGFYTTTSLDQAERWARRRADKGGKPIVNQYEYTPTESLSVCSFSDTDDDWLDFVVKCRSSREVPHDFDIVTGPMADDQIWNQLTQFIRGEINREQFMVLCRFLHPTQQTSFHTANALLTLKFLGAEEVK